MYIRRFFCVNIIIVTFIKKRQQNFHFELKAMRGTHTHIIISQKCQTGRQYIRSAFFLTFNMKALVFINERVMFPYFCGSGQKLSGSPSNVIV